ncbi:energy-coupling factor ABC transporter ATP-binding protein [Embleya sp. NBC_00896]|uniref:energy-coupling factor ABC transporter ATP-binding protein n=1 Tax=Embleya sp. NBC_00896 TaxID=2975961 RepID=UPI00386AA0C1|nr:ATP-binding cassette domain-containing protein [Embleya sp. NBC_00896]
MIPLRVREIGYAYEDGPTVLSGLSLTIAQGRALALLGPNGSGKTTLLRLLTGGLVPNAGTVELRGEPIRHDRKGLTALRRTVQLVVQDPDDQLFSASVAQDVSFGPLNLGLEPAEVRSRVAEALTALDITALAERPVHLLSFGQRKRVAIAGAIAMRPEVLVLDEPTAGLDPAGQEALLNTLAELREAGTTVVMATHDVDLALRWADDAAVLAHGRLHTGPADDLLADTELLAAASLRPTWAHAAAAVLRAHGLLPEGGFPRTPAELAALAVRTG